MLKIETGSMKGLTFDTVPDNKTRYTTGQLRLTLMNIFDVSGVNMLDIFGGSGSFTYESISNGAEHSTIVDQSKKSISTISKNAAKLKIKDKLTIVNMDFRRAFEKFEADGLTFNFIFADPPFELDLCDEFLKHLDEHSKIIQDGSYLILERSVREKPAYKMINFTFEQTRNYGDIEVDIYYRNFNEEE